MRRFMMVCLLAALLPACSTRTSEQVSTDLWKTWESMDELVQQDYPDQPPVILIHGWNGGEFTWPAPEKLKVLEDRLHQDIYLFNYRTGIVANRYPPLEVLEEKLDRFLVEYPRVDVVAHSMGGLLLRQYLSHHPDNPVRRVVFLSTPHFGTNAARFLTGIASLSSEGNIQASEIRPGSDFLWQLNDLEGSEMMDIEVLNVYAGEESFLESDFIVDAASAYLPWGHNVQVKGDHHTLAKRLPSFDFIVRFLSDGSLPDLAPPPERRDAWLHFVRHVGDTPEAFSGTSLKRLNVRGVNQPAGIAVCCDVRSGLFPMGGNVAVIENMRPDEKIVYRSKQVNKTVELESNELRKAGIPVQLKTVLLEQDEATDSEKSEKHISSGAGKASVPDEGVAPAVSQPVAPELPAAPDQSIGMP